MRFENKVVLVTGSSSGIGEETARLFATEGALVVVNSSSSVVAGEAVAASLPGAIYVQADISDAAASARLIDATIEHHGRLDVLVHASVIPEPFGQVVVEGMAAGLPVIASNEGGPAEVITNGVDGLLVAPADPEGLAAVLRRVATDSELRRRLGEQARCSARAFTPDRVGAQVMQVYSEVLEARR